MLPYHFEHLVAIVLEALNNTGGKSFKVRQSDISWRLLPKKLEETLLKSSLGSLSYEARNSKDLSLLKIRRVWCVIEEGLLSSPVDPLVCVPFADWQLGTRVCVGADRTHLLSAWLYMVCFVFASPGRHWHIEVFISRKQVVEERDMLVRMSLFPCLPVCIGTTLNLYTVCISWRAYMCLTACVYTLALTFRWVWYLEVCSKGE